MIIIFVLDDKKYCKQCQKVIRKSLWSSHLRTNIHKNNSFKVNDDGDVEIIKSAFKERIISYKIAANSFYINFVEFCDHILPKIMKIMKLELHKHTCIKLNMELFGLYLNPNDESHSVKSFNTPFRVICNSSELNNEVDEMVGIMDRKADELAEKDSGN